ncbi:MAG: trypsin-like peptidase domain-containing protein [Pseudohongiellaceae bacterium]
MKIFPSSVPLFCLLVLLSAPVPFPGSPAPVIYAQDYSAFKTDDEENNIEIFKQAGPSVVNITNSRIVRSFYTLNPQEVPLGSGSGFIWDKEGHVITNFHVVRDASRMTVTLPDGSSFDAVPVGVAPDKDVAVLKIDAPQHALNPVSLGDSSLLEVGRKVIAIGNPFGLDNTMTVGVVSALGREIDSVVGRKIRDVIQTDAAINPGNSGGPLLNSMGQLVGVNTAIFSPSGASSGIGFAIPVNSLKNIVNDLIAYGRVQTPILGVSLLPQAYANQIRGLEGLVILDVFEGGPAHEGGMRGVTRSGRGLILGDVIQSVDGEEIASQDDLLTVLEAHEPGDEVTVVTLREGRREEYRVELEAPSSP